MNVPKHDSLMAGLPVWARWRDGDLLLSLHVQPGARRTALAGVHGARLKIALHAPPVDGKANEELLRFLSARLGVRRSQVRLVGGPASREKCVAVGAEAGQARQLAALLEPGG
jgi:uncharacterized protein (TIGR00251 family)